jgi:precorrin-4 methylase
MIIYSVMPMELVLEGMDQKEEIRYMDIMLNGIQMQVQPLNERQASIVRIISGDPQVYLNPDYYPGKLIEFQPVTR